MTTEAQVRSATNPQEAILALAQALDRIEISLASLCEGAAAEGSWGEWSLPPTSTEVRERFEARSAAPELVIHEDDEPEVKAAKLRLLHDQGKGIQLGSPKGEQTLTDGDDVVLPPPTPDQKAERYQFALEILKLDKALPGIEDPSNAYARGGPMWLYLGNRDLVMAQPPHVKQAMIADVERFSPKDAYDMARDILKEKAPTGPELTMGALLRD